MTNLETVRSALSGIKNVNNGVTLDMIFDHINAGLETPILTRDQIKRAMKDIKYARKIDRDLWTVKGRAITGVTGISGVYPRYVKMDEGLNKRDMKKLQIRTKRALANF